MVHPKILIEKQISCPVCRSISFLRYTNPRLYVAASRESDLHVVSYRWAEGIKNATPPHYFAVWQCPHCLFADLKDSIEKPEGGIKREQLLNSYLKSKREKRTVLHKLRGLVPEGEPDFKGAVAIHLAALKIARLPDQQYIDHNKVGRIALRLGWLFREMGAEPVGATGAIGDDENADIQSDIERLQNLLADLGSTIGDLRRKVTAHSPFQQSGETGRRDRYASLSTSLYDKLEEMRNLTASLHSAVIRERLGSINAAYNPEAKQSLSLKEILLPMRSHWPDLPASEKECLRIAISALDYSYRNETAFSSIEQSTKVVMLIVNLLCRVGDNEAALRYISEVYKSGMRNINELSRRIQEGKSKKSISPHDERMLRRKIANIQFSIRQAGEMRHELLDLLYKQHAATIDRILEGVADKPPQVQEKVLIQAGIPEEMVPDLRSRGVINDPKRQHNFNRKAKARS